MLNPLRFVWFFIHWFYSSHRIEPIKLFCSIYYALQDYLIICNAHVIYLCNMKRILISAIIVILSFNTACIAQISSGRIYSLGNSYLKRTRVMNVHLADPNDSISSPSSPVLPEQNASTEQSSYSIEELKSLIERYEREISLSKSTSRVPSVGKSKRIHSYRQWNPRELNLKNLTDVITEVGLSNKLFVLAQAILETGNFSSRVCKEYNNLFGLYDS